MRHGPSPVLRCIYPAQRAAPPVPAVVGGKTPAQRGIGDPLQFGIQGRPDRETAAIKSTVTKGSLQFSANFLDEVVGPGRIHRTGWTHPNPPRHFCGRGGKRNIAVFGHTVQHVIPASARRFRTANGMIVVGRLRQTGKKCGLCKRQVVQRFIEIVQRCGSNAIGPESQVDFVQIELKDLILRKRPLDPQRKDDLLRFTGDGDLVCEQKILRHLLGDGRGADRAPVGIDPTQVRDRCANDARDIDPPVGVERLVLSGQKRPDDLLGHRLDRYEHPFFARELRHQTAVARVDPRYHRRIIVRKLLVFGETSPEMVKAVQNSSGAGDRQHHQHQKCGSQNSHTYPRGRSAHQARKHYTITMWLF